MSVWRLQTRTGSGHICEYCLNNSVAAMGWSLSDISEAERNNIKTFAEFSSYAELFYENFDSVKRLESDVRPGDLIWMRYNGIYYIGRVDESSKWVFNSSKEATEADASNQLTNIKWQHHEISDEDTVPGVIATAFIKGSTFQRINKSGAMEYSALLYDRLAGTEYYSDIKLELSEANFYSLLSPEDSEDLLCLWLYHKYGYIAIPSTNKIATQLYECVLVDPKDGKHIYVQVKKGNIEIDADVYKDLNGIVWFLNTEGTIKNIDKYTNMHIVKPTELYEFALSEESENIMSESIKLWTSFLTMQNNENLKTKIKGIMFDTNKSFSDTSEKYMLENSRVSAWGNAQKYIHSFNKGDYVFFYSKSKGIIAIGKIKSDKTFESGNESYREVEPIVFPESYDEQSMAYISPREIKDELHKSFYFASTIKLPFLSEDDSKILISLLKEKINNQK